MPGPGQLSRLLTRWVELRRQGNHVAVEDLCADSPELLEPMRRQVEALRLLPGDAAPRTVGDTPPPGSGDLPATKEGAGHAPDGASTEPSPTVPGYQLLGELGRGGMGVVYLARQEALDRLVALKVLLAGTFADSGQRARLRSEARAAARLRHPNIVQVYETGEHAGVPYLTLEFIEGGNLARRLKAGPMPPREAATLVETLARAVEAAHQDGIFHRDLKPANVLLSLDGTPKITDFGLAKQLDAETSLTRTGTVLGTPAYMAPEQAAGSTKEIGPATDVYGLGAILYQCLTGRPPFRAATHELTILEVLTKAPKAPRRLHSGVPPELEAICLKCLRKEPSDRYAKAVELAEDLRLFLCGGYRPRRIGLFRGALRLLKQRPSVSVTVAVNAVVVIGLVLFWALRAGPTGSAVASTPRGPVDVSDDRSRPPKKPPIKWQRRLIVNQAPRSGASRFLERPTPVPRLWVLLIGVSQHQDKRINRSFSGADAELLAHTFRERGGVPEERVRVLSDTSPPDLRPTQVNIRRQLADFLQHPTKDDSVLVFFSGHGDKFDDRTLLIPSDFIPERANETGIALSELRDQLGRCKASAKYLVLDAKVDTESSPAGVAESDSPSVQPPASSVPGLVVLASSQSNKPAWDWPTGGQGLFTHCLNRGLEGAADGNGDGLITAIELERFVRPSVERVSVDFFQSKQTPLLFPRIGGQADTPILSLQPEPVQKAFDRLALLVREQCLLHNVQPLVVDTRFAAQGSSPVVDAGQLLGPLAESAPQALCDALRELERRAIGGAAPRSPVGNRSEPSRQAYRTRAQREKHTCSRLGDIIVESMTPKEGKAATLGGTVIFVPDPPRAVLNCELRAGQDVLAVISVVIAVDADLHRFLKDPK